LATAEAETTRKALKIAQAGLHVSYLKKIQANQYCSIESKTLFMLNQPYETSKVVLLDTTLDGKTKLRKDTWNLMISKIEKGIRFKHLFYLDLKVELESIYQSAIKTTIAEKEIKDSLNLKPLFGSAP
jgi:hypothetical protein